MRYVLFALFAATCLAAGAQGVKTDDKKEVKKEAKEDKKGEIYEIAGKRLDQWIKEIRSADPSRRETAMRTVILFGPEKAYQAVPPILAELKKHHRDTPIDLSVRYYGTKALVDALTGVKEPDPKYVKETVAAFKNLLKWETQVIVKIQVLEALPRLGPEARAAVQEVRDLTRDVDTWETRRTAIKVLVLLAADPDKLPEPPTLGALYRALQDNSFQVRLQALQALATLGRPGELSQKSVMINELRKATGDKDLAVQLWAHMAIMTVKQDITADHLRPIGKMLREPDVIVRGQAAQALGMIGPIGAKAVGADLDFGLGDADPGVVLLCINSVMRMEYTPAMKTLQAIIDDPAGGDDPKNAPPNRSEEIKNAARAAVQELLRAENAKKKK